MYNLGCMHAMPTRHQAFALMLLYLAALGLGGTEDMPAKYKSMQSALVRLAVRLLITSLFLLR